MRYILTIFIFGFAFQTFGQDLKTIQKDLQQTVISDLKEVRKKANNIYRLDPYNEFATYYLATSYKYTNHNDSIPILFAKLKSINPENPTPYILSAKIQFQELSISDTSRLAELRIALKLDSTNFEAHYLLGTSYYTLFNKQQTNYYAAESRFHLIKATQIDNSSLAYLKYPIIQTSFFLQDRNFISAYDSKEASPSTDSLNIPKSSWYFPLTSFLQLENNWRTDYSLDIIRQVGMATFVLDWYSGQLHALKEPLVFNQTDKTIYRFTWLRTFDNPVAIRIEKKDNTYILFWKSCSGAGGYEPGELTVDKSKPLAKEQFDNFISLIQSTDFWNMPTNLRDELGNDGSQWIIEGIENGKYHVVDRWTPRKNNYQKCGQYLIELTDLKIKGRDLY
ncbi:MAG TPA: hypothetical protein VL093_02805 [Flavipsychrobacter sp.]|nr:hypothetical protein [Flavipsychrobacter sp.]